MKQANIRSCALGPRKANPVPLGARDLQREALNNEQKERPRAKGEATALLRTTVASAANAVQKRKR